MLLNQRANPADDKQKLHWIGDMCAMTYGVRSLPKLTIGILNRSFKFSTSKLEFYSWILYFILFF